MDGPRLPWRKFQENQTYGAAIIVDADDRTVTDCNSGSRSTREAIKLAETIIRAVNATAAQESRP
jgi:uncharacterized protein (UPF0548 family)